MTINKSDYADGKAINRAITQTVDNLKSFNNDINALMDSIERTTGTLDNNYKNLYALYPTPDTAVDTKTIIIDTLSSLQGENTNRLFTLDKADEVPDIISEYSPFVPETTIMIKDQNGNYLPGYYCYENINFPLYNILKGEPVDIKVFGWDDTVISNLETGSFADEVLGFVEREDDGRSLLTITTTPGAENPIWFIDKSKVKLQITFNFPEKLLVVPAAIALPEDMRITASINGTDHTGSVSDFAQYDVININKLVYDSEFNFNTGSTNSSDNVITDLAAKTLTAGVDTTIYRKLK